ncbi:hypothetical protein O1L60_42550 [Streptomyces diastatochromogenes]|nr:hypothetical protein [Streptomyces diastatochromogenes]
MPAIDPRPDLRPLALTLAAGVRPIRPQVLAHGEVIDYPASSSKAIQAPRSAAALLPAARSPSSTPQPRRHRR